jgi:hypothetical protein
MARRPASGLVGRFCAAGHAPASRHHPQRHSTWSVCARSQLSARHRASLLHHYHPHAHDTHRFARRPLRRQLGRRRVVARFQHQARALARGFVGGRGGHWQARKASFFSKRRGKETNVVKKSKSTFSLFIFHASNGQCERKEAPLAAPPPTLWSGRRVRELSGPGRLIFFLPHPFLLPAMDDDVDALLDLAADLDQASWGDGDGGEAKEGGGWKTGCRRFDFDCAGRWGRLCSPLPHNSIYSQARPPSRASAPWARWTPMWQVRAGENTRSYKNTKACAHDGARAGRPPRPLRPPTLTIFPSHNIT